MSCLRSYCKLFNLSETAALSVLDCSFCTMHSVHTHTLHLDQYIRLHIILYVSVAPNQFTVHAIAILQVAN